MPFVKGVSGNPGGRKKLPITLREICKAAAPRMIERLLELAESDDERVAVVACNSVLDRAYGKPTQLIGGDKEAGPVQVQVSADAVRQKVARLIADVSEASAAH